jgi:hypothetical protein
MEWFHAEADITQNQELGGILDYSTYYQNACRIGTSHYSACSSGGHTSCFLYDIKAVKPE